MTFSENLSALRGLIARFRRERGGNVAVVFAIAIIPIIGTVGAAVDYSRASDARTHLQDALDSAVLGGVLQSADEQISAATSIFNANFSETGNDGKKIAANASFVQNSDGTLSGTASIDLQTMFLRVLGFSSLDVGVASRAATTKTESNVCILLVAPSKSQSLLVNSGAKLNAPNCEIHVLSTLNPAAMFNATLNVKRICVKGTSVTKNGGVAPPVETSCQTITDPFAGKLPKVSVGACDHSNQVYNPGNVTLSPGVYCGSTNFNGSGTLTLNPGVYVIKSGAMIFNSGWTITGNGVTFYLVDQNATITFNGNVKATLTAPTTGTYANILMFEPTGLSNTNLPINGSSGDSMQGLLYLPSRDVTINSVSNLSADKTTMVFSSLILNSTNWSVDAGALKMTVATGNGGARLVN